MTTVALPLWLLITILTVPMSCLFAMLIRSVYKRRQKSHSASDTSADGDRAMGNFGRQNAFHQDLYALQIDAVFNALSALIETERIKLKSLLCPTLPHFPEIPVSTSNTAPPPAVCEAPAQLSLNQQIAERAAMGESVDDIAGALDISQTEVELAISMNSEHLSGRQNRLEAVA